MGVALLRSEDVTANGRTPTAHHGPHGAKDEVTRSFFTSPRGAVDLMSDVFDCGIVRLTFRFS